MSKIHIVDTKNLEHKSHQELLSMYYDWYRRTGGVMDDELKALFPYMSLCSTICEANKSPEILVVGNQSSQTKAYSTEWSQNADTMRSTPYSELEQLSAGGYLDALQNKAHHSIVDFNDQGTHLVFERLITPLKLKPGTKIDYLGYAGVILGHHVQ